MWFEGHDSFFAALPPDFGSIHIRLRQSSLTVADTRMSRPCTLTAVYSDARLETIRRQLEVAMTARLHLLAAAGEWSCARSHKALAWASAPIRGTICYRLADLRRRLIVAVWSYGLNANPLERSPFFGLPDHSGASRLPERPLWTELVGQFLERKNRAPGMTSTCCGLQDAPWR